MEINMQLKIGELALRAGLSVRALHHYDAIKLLSPSLRMPGGARLYGQADVIRLHRIQALKQMGYGLAQIQQALKDVNLKPVDILLRQAAVLEAQAAQAQALAQRLKHVANDIVMHDGQTQASDWLDLLEMMTIYARHLTPQEMSALQAPDHKAAQRRAAQWRKLVAEVATAMRQGIGPDAPQAQALAWRWVRLVIAMTHNNAELAGKLKSLQEHELRAQEILGINTAMFEWMGLAIAHARLALFAKHLSARQLAAVRKRQLATTAHMDAWPALVARVRAQLEAGVSCRAKAMQQLARQWHQLFLDAYCGEDKALEAQVRQAFAAEPDLSLGVGVDPPLMDYIHAAIQYMHSKQQPSPTTKP